MAEPEETPSESEEFPTLSHHPLLQRVYELTTGAPPEDEELAELFHPDVTLDFTDRDLNPQVYEGFEGVRQLISDLRTSLEEFKFEVEEVHEVGPFLVSFIHTRGRLPGDGAPVSLMSAHSWLLEDNKVRSVRYFSDRDTALRAAGGSGG